MATAFATFIAVFDRFDCSEREFEIKLWTQLQALHDVDRASYVVTCPAIPTIQVRLLVLPEPLFCCGIIS